MTAPKSVDSLLENARTHIVRLTPTEAAEAMASGALFIDLRPLEYRWRYGEIIGAIPVSRHVLEWRLDPSSEHRIQELDAGDYEHEIVLMCNEGYTSSLAAHTLMRDLGLKDVKDVIGGFAGWAAEGLPYLSRLGAPAMPSGHEPG